MSRGRKAPYGDETIRKAIEYREMGLTNQETGEELKLTEHQVQWIMRKTGNTRRWAYYRPPNDKPKRKGRTSIAMSMVNGVDRYGVVTVEAGLNGGYIATVGELHTGSERHTVLAALRSAEQVADAVEGWRFAG